MLIDNMSDDNNVDKFVYIYSCSTYAFILTAKTCFSILLLEAKCYRIDSK